MKKWFAVLSLLLLIMSLVLDSDAFARGGGTHSKGSHSVHVRSTRSSHSYSIQSKSSYSKIIKKHRYDKTIGVARDKRGRIKRSAAAKREFMRETDYPYGRPGYVVDHVIALKRGGRDDPSNMQWQTVQEGKAKDKWE